MIMKRLKKQQRFNINNEISNQNIEGEKPQSFSPSSSALHEINYGNIKQQQSKYPINIQHPQCMSNMHYGLYMQPVINVNNYNNYFMSNGQVPMLSTTPSNNNLKAINPTYYYTQNQHQHYRETNNNVINSVPNYNQFVKVPASNLIIFSDQIKVNQYITHPIRATPRISVESSYRTENLNQARNQQPNSIKCNFVNINHRKKC
jgi:hypothetical protein